MLSRTAMCINHQALSRTNTISKRIVCRSMHITCQIRNTGIRTNSIFKISKFSPALGNCTKRYSSTTEATIINEPKIAATTIENPIITSDVATASIDALASKNVTENVQSKLLESIPDVPVPPTVLETVKYIGDPPFSELGLGGWTPVGIVQHSLEFMHVSCGLPWWESIMLGTLVLRCLLFPLVIKVQRNAAMLNNNLPELTRIQLEISEAKQCGDHITAMKRTRELMKFMKTNNCNPMRNMILPLLQAPIFLSVFLGLRRMAELPVETMKHGGLWWFTDLTVADPYYLLPLITATTLFVTIEVGTDSARAKSMGMMRYVFRAVPIVILPFTINFPTALLCYWVSSNFISLLQVAVLKVPKVRTFFKIPPLKKHKKLDVAGQKGFVEGVKHSIANMKSARELNARSHADEVQFHRAGRGPIKPTYSYDPTKPVIKKRATVMAKNS